MDIKESKTIEMLTKDSVNILTQKFIEIDGEMVQVGENHRQIYRNFAQDRNILIINEPEDVANAVMAIWGKEPSIVIESELTEAEASDIGG